MPSARRERERTSRSIVFAALLAIFVVLDACQDIAGAGSITAAGGAANVLAIVFGLLWVFRHELHSLALTDRQAVESTPAACDLPHINFGDPQ